jgi:hypothetical protein
MEFPHICKQVQEQEKLMEVAQAEDTLADQMLVHPLDLVLWQAQVEDQDILIHHLFRPQH